MLFNMICISKKERCYKLALSIKTPLCVIERKSQLDITGFTVIAAQIL